MHVEDLISVQRQLGYRYELPHQPAQHYQWLCPRCRRIMLALAQGQLWDPIKVPFRQRAIATCPHEQARRLNESCTLQPTEHDNANFARRITSEAHARCGRS